MAALVFRCPATGLNAQGWFLGEAPIDEGTYEAVSCLACGQAHLVNRFTGKVLGEDAD